MISIRLAEEKDMPEIKKIANTNRRYLGFTKRVALGDSIAKSELSVAVSGKEIVGFISWHKRRDAWTTVYKLCVNELHRRHGIGKKLMEVIGSGPAKLKCHSDNPAIQFYNHLGFKTVGIEITKGGKKLDFLTRE